jgi:hypothetical protein
MRAVRQESFGQIFGIGEESAKKVDKIANKYEYKKELKLNKKIVEHSRRIDND